MRLLDGAPPFLFFAGKGCEHAWRPGAQGDPVADGLHEDLVDTRGRVGADQQNPPALPCQVDRGARQLGLADAAIRGGVLATRHRPPANTLWVDAGYLVETPSAYPARHRCNRSTVAGYGDYFPYQGADSDTAVPPPGRRGRG